MALPRIEFIQKQKAACTGHSEGRCSGACIGEESTALYNFRVKRAIKQLENLLPSFALIDNGRSDDEKSCLWVEKGKFYGMGYISDCVDINDLEMLKSAIIPFPSNDYIMNMILSHSSQFPNKVISVGA